MRSVTAAKAASITAVTAGNRRRRSDARRPRRNRARRIRSSYQLQVVGVFLMEGAAAVRWDLPREQPNTDLERHWRPSPGNPNENRGPKGPGHGNSRAVLSLLGTLKLLAIAAASMIVFGVSERSPAWVDQQMAQIAEPTPSAGSRTIFEPAFALIMFRARHDDGERISCGVERTLRLAERGAVHRIKCRSRRCGTSSSRKKP